MPSKTTLYIVQRCFTQNLTVLPLQWAPCHFVLSYEVFFQSDHLFPFIHHHVNLFSDHLQPYIQKFVTQDRMKYTQLNIWQSNVMIKWGLYSFSTDGCCHFGKLNLSLQNLLIIAQVPIWTISLHSNAGLEIFEKVGARCENYDRKYLTTYTTTLANVH